MGRHRIHHSALRVFAFLIAMCWSMMTVVAVPVDDALQFGDIVTLSLPGEEALSKPFAIDRNGQIHLPEVGPVMLSGLSVSAASVTIREALGQAYRDLDRLTVTLSERKLLITVLGYVKVPGTYKLPGDANVQMAISEAGGLSQGAQLDRFQLRRGTEKTPFNYKSYLDSGDVGILPTLRTLDTIFVPASPIIGNVQVDFDGRWLAEAGDGAERKSAVKIFGEVKNPASFSYDPDASVIDLIMRAGGVTRYAAVEQIRVIANNEPLKFNLQSYLDTGDASALPRIAPGATIFVPKQVEEVRRSASTVYVMGEVAKPGAFESPAQASFIDILANAGGPTRFADTRQIRILRSGGEVTMVDLTKYTEGNGGTLPEVMPGDAIFVPEKTEAQEPSWLKIPPTRAVQVMGAVYKPGRFEWSDEMSLFDLVAQAGGPTAQADIANLQILQKNAGQARAITFDMEKFLTKGGQISDIPQIRAGYVIVVPELPQDPSDNKSQWVRQGSDQSIYVMGQVGAPGRYAFNTNLHFLDIIAAADGPTGGADLRNIRVSHRDQRGSRISKVNLARYFETGDDQILPTVRPGDVIYIPGRDREWLDVSKESTIRVLGAVAKPGRYTFEDDMTILDLLAEAGGPTSAAMQNKIVIANLSCCRDQARVFDLIGFAKSANTDMLPVVRAGDTVYVPDLSQSAWRKFFDGFKDVMPLISLMTLIAAL